MRSRGHSILASAPLIPQNDATTLFTGSGMQPLVPYLLGREHQQGARLADSQKCFRANDIDEVGDNRHTTFFEMLGNWSLGDYFKEEQIRQCFAFFTDSDTGLGLDPNRLYVTAFAGDDTLGIPRDDTAADMWKQLFSEAGVSAETAHIGSQEDGDRRGMKPGERIFFYDAGKNWWSRSGPPESMPSGEPGGPDTEVFYDFGDEHVDPAYAHLKPHPNSDSGRFIEICNSVFMEYLRTADGFKPLPKKNVDFGAGLERLTAVTERTPDIFAVDVFAPCIRALEEKTDSTYIDNPTPFRVIADHLRSAIFILADGVTPSNTDRGYVLRRLIREAVYRLRYALRIEDMNLAELVPHFVAVYEKQYPETAAEHIQKHIAEEEERFSRTLRKGMNIFNALAEKKTVTGGDVFTLQSTYGFPKELTAALAEERGIVVSLETYDEAMRKHKEFSGRGGEKKFKGGLADTDGMSVKYHTATHLLHQALRDVLGDAAEQRGSNITPKRLRFDFVHDGRMTDEEKKRVEDIVNGKIREGLDITYTDMPRAEAENIGAIGIFTYDDPVRVYSVGNYSKEYCGGPHVRNTRELGTFSIIREEAVSAGVRRIRAVLR